MSTDADGEGGDSFWIVVVAVVVVDVDGKQDVMVCRLPHQQ